MKWVHTNIEAFGGDPVRVLSQGLSRGHHYSALLRCFPSSVLPDNRFDNNSPATLRRTTS